jgi:hypothetical protein
MIKYILCFLLGHKKHCSKSMPDGNVIKTVDILGNELLTISVCERCGKVYSNLVI